MEPTRIPIAVLFSVSFRSKSPEDMWEKPYFLEIFLHWTPLPHPGPPRTQMMGTLMFRGLALQLNIATEMGRNDGNLKILISIEDEGDEDDMCDVTFDKFVMTFLMQRAQCQT